MKGALTLVFLIVSLNHSLMAQVVTGNLPENKGAFVLAKGTDSTELEKMTAKRLTTGGNMGNGYKLNFEGNASMVKIKKAAVLYFLYHFKTGEEKFKLVKLNQLKKKRQIYTYDAKIMVKEDISPELIECKFEKYTDMGFLISVENLEVGEYAFVPEKHNLRNDYVNKSKGVKRNFYGFSIID